MKKIVPLTIKQRAAISEKTGVCDRTIVRAYLGKAGNTSLSLVTIAAELLGLPLPPQKDN